MGTRADFYVKKADKDLTIKSWIGSIAWDGYPDGIPKEIKETTTEKEFRKAVKNFAKEREDFTSIKDGWPWPWFDSTLTDYSYVFDCGISKVKWHAFDKKTHWPNMSSISKIALGGKRSGLIVIGAR